MCKAGNLGGAWGHRKTWEGLGTWLVRKIISSCLQEQLRSLCIRFQWFHHRYLIPVNVYPSTCISTSLFTQTWTLISVANSIQHWATKSTNFAEILVHRFHACLISNKKPNHLLYTGYATHNAQTGLQDTQVKASSYTCKSCLKPLCIVCGCDITSVSILHLYTYNRETRTLGPIQLILAIVDEAKFERKRGYRLCFL